MEDRGGLLGSLRQTGIYREQNFYWGQILLFPCCILLRMEMEPNSLLENTKVYSQKITMNPEMDLVTIRFYLSTAGKTFLANFSRKKKQSFSSWNCTQRICKILLRTNSNITVVNASKTFVTTECAHFFW